MLAEPATLTARRRRWQFRRSPQDQATWARPALLVVTALAAFLYSYRSAPYLELYYFAAVRSMSMSWHNFFFGTFDPSATISIDKLPGAFWVQALSVRIFSLHPWAIVLSQILEGVLSVLVLFRVVRRSCRYCLSRRVPVSYRTLDEPVLD